MTQDFVTHRCKKRPDGIGIRKYIKPQQRWYGLKVGKWYLYHTEFDTEWDVYLYLRVCTIEYCPFCGCKLEGGVGE